MDCRDAVLRSERGLQAALASERNDDSFAYRLTPCVRSLKRHECRAPGHVHYIDRRAQRSFAGTERGFEFRSAAVGRMISGEISA